MFPPDDERSTPKYWLKHGTKKQKRRAHAVLFRGTNSDRDRAFRSKVKKKYDEIGIIAIVGGKLGRPIDVELHGEVRLAIQEVQETKVRPKRSDFKKEIESRLDKTISPATLTRYLNENGVKIRPRKGKQQRKCALR